MPNNKSIKLKIPCGYKTIEKNVTLPFNDARRLLSTKKLGRYTSIKKQNEDILLSSHIIKCPYCAGETPAYSHYLYDFGKMHYSLQKELINNFLNSQISFLEKENFLRLNNPENYKGEFYCKKCGNISSASTKALDICITSTNDSVYISRQVSSIEDLMTIDWIDSVNINFSFPFKETVELNIKTGESYIFLTDSSDNTIQKKDFWRNLNLVEKCFFNMLIRKNRLVKRRLRKAFCEVSGYEINFTMAELSLRNFVLMTKFTGLRKYFYDAIPLLKYKTRIDESFSYITNKIRNQESIMKLLKASSLPDTKSVRKIFYDTPGLIFYIKECEKLFDITKNIDCLRILLCNPETYNILSHLHVYPGLTMFYYDYCKEKGRIHFTKHLINSLQAFNIKAAQYALLSSDMRKKETALWKGKKYFLLENFHSDFFCIDFSLPLATLNESIKDYRIGKFQFKKLRTTADRFCENITYEDIQILLNNRPIGTIWIDTLKSTAYLQLKSGNVQKNSSLHKAAQKWCSKNSLKSIADFYDD